MTKIRWCDWEHRGIISDVENAYDEKVWKCIRVNNLREKAREKRQREKWKGKYRVFRSVIQFNRFLCTPLCPLSVPWLYNNLMPDIISYLLSGALPELALFIPVWKLKSARDSVWWCDLLCPSLFSLTLSFSLAQSLFTVSSATPNHPSRFRRSARIKSWNRPSVKLRTCLSLDWSNAFNGWS